MKKLFADENGYVSPGYLLLAATIAGMSVWKEGLTKITLFIYVEKSI